MKLNKKIQNKKIAINIMKINFFKKKTNMKMDNFLLKCWIEKKKQFYKELKEEITKRIRTKFWKIKIKNLD
jgi:hypothetical protein